MCFRRSDLLLLSSNTWIPFQIWDHNCIKCNFFLLILAIYYFKEENIHNRLNVEINESSTVWLALGPWPSVPGWRMSKLVWAEVIATLTQVQLSSPKYRSCEAIERIVSDERKRSALYKAKCTIMRWSCQQFKEGPWCTWALYYLPNSNNSRLTNMNHANERLY